MADLKDLTIEELQNTFHPMEFQWIKGDYSGSMESYKSITSDGENKFILFKSGRRINVELLDEFMVYFPAPPQIQQLVEAPTIPVDSNRSKNSKVTSIVYDSIPGATEDSPIYKLLKKQKKNPVEVGIKLKLNLPPKELFVVLSSSFEDAEKEIIKFVLDGIDIEDIKLALSDSIKKNYYQIGLKTEKNNVIKSNGSISTKKTIEHIEDESDET